MLVSLQKNERFFAKFVTICKNKKIKAFEQKRKI